MRQRKSSPCTELSTHLVWCNDSRACLLACLLAQQHIRHHLGHNRSLTVTSTITLRYKRLEGSLAQRQRKLQAQAVEIKSSLSMLEHLDGMADGDEVCTDFRWGRPKPPPPSSPPPPPPPPPRSQHPPPPHPLALCPPIQLLKPHALSHPSARHVVAPSCVLTALRGACILLLSQRVCQFLMPSARNSLQSTRMPSCCFPRLTHHAPTSLLFAASTD
jgi:hypothetical protein